MADDDLKACCAAAYSSDVVALLLGDSYHPGGTTALLLADAYGVRVDGVDYSPAGVAAGALDERATTEGRVPITRSPSQ